MAQTSDRVSSIAARMVVLSPGTVQSKAGNPAELNAFVKDVRSMAASLLRQDEVKGLRRLALKFATRGLSASSAGLPRR